MQYLLLMCSDETADSGRGRLPRAARRRRTRRWVHETEARGVRLLAGARLDLGTTAKTVRDRGGELLVTDGPFAETKDLVAGFEVIECADLGRGG